MTELIKDNHEATREWQPLNEDQVMGLLADDESPLIKDTCKGENEQHLDSEENEDARYVFRLIGRG